MRRTADADRSARRAFLRGVTGLGLAAAAGLRIRDAATPLQAQGRDAAPAARTSSGTVLLLLGTQGGPNVNLSRSQAAHAVIVNGEPYLVDCGYGALRGLVQANIGYNDVSHVFLTHLHDDHTTDIPALLTHKWTSGRARATTTHGPYGTRALVDAAHAFLAPNVEIRIVDEGRTERPQDLFRGRDLEATPAPSEVFRDERVTVRAVENAHFPDRAKARMPYRSVAYRFETPDRSIVFSGDTAYSPGLVALARGADILVCETIDMALHAQLTKTAEAEEARTKNPNSVARHIVETHVTTEDVGRMAAQANVRMVVLTHILPGSNPQRGGDLPDTTYIEAVRKHFQGEVIVGRDQMRL